MHQCENLLCSTCGLWQRRRRSSKEGRWNGALAPAGWRRGPAGLHTAGEVGRQPVGWVQCPHQAQLNLGQRVGLPVDLQSSSSSSVTKTSHVTGSGEGDGEGDREATLPGSRGRRLPAASCWPKGNLRARPPAGRAERRLFAWASLSARCCSSHHAPGGPVPPRPPPSPPSAPPSPPHHVAKLPHPWPTCPPCSPAKETHKKQDRVRPKKF